MKQYIIGFVVACISWIFILSITPVQEGHYYDCGMAEWHPDFPKEVKEACRNLKRSQSQGYRT
jgi:hypothetical protein